MEEKLLPLKDTKALIPHFTKKHLKTSQVLHDYGQPTSAF